MGQVSIWFKMDWNSEYGKRAWSEAVLHANEAERLIGIADWWAERGVAVRFGKHGLGVTMLRDVNREDWVY